MPSVDLREMKKDFRVEHQRKNNKFFLKMSRIYDLFEIVLAPTRQKVVNLLKKEKVSTILDLACGTGSLSIALAKQGYVVTGLDLSPDMLARAQQKLQSNLKLSFQLGDATQLSLKDHSFDATTISLGLHDMPYEMELAVLTEMKRVTKKDGVIVVVEYLEPIRHSAARMVHPVLRSFETENYQPFIKKTLVKLLTEVGLMPDRTETVLGLFQVVLVRND